METHCDWKPAGLDLAAVLKSHPRPLDDLASGVIPAVVLRNQYPADACRRLLERLIERGLLHDPGEAMPAKFVEQSIPEGFYREGVSAEASRAWAESAPGPEGKHRVDIGTSLGYRGSDREQFFAHAAETRRLFRDLFDGLPHPVDLIYARLGELSRTGRAVTAYEPDGRRYGPAIIRAHYGAYTYKPHFDSVRLREKRENYAVYRFEHQFAGVLVLSNAEGDGRSAQCVLHRYFWQPEVSSHLEEGTFHEFAEARGIESHRVELNPGDLYFFNTRSIHEVPGVDGESPRVVLATFIGYSADEEEIFVWS